MASKNASIQSSPPMPLTHRQLRALLPEYTALIALQRVDMAEYSNLEAHIATCTACRREVEALMVTLQASAAGQIEPAPDYPTFNLDFLNTKVRSRAAPRPWSITALGQLIIRFSDDVLRAIQPLPMAAQPRSGRGSSRDLLYQYDHERFVGDGEDQRYLVTVEIYGTAESADQVEVIVRVRIPGRSAASHAGSQVTIVGPHLQVSGITEKFGYVTFKQIPRTAVPSLQISISPAPEAG